MQFNEEMLTAYLDDELSSDEREIVEQTIVAVPACAQLLEDLRGVRDAIARLPAIEPSTDPVAAVGQRIADQQATNQLARDRRIHALGRVTVFATAASLMFALGAYLLRSPLTNELSPHSGVVATKDAPRDPQIAESEMLDDQVADIAAVDSYAVPIESAPADRKSSLAFEAPASSVQQDKAGRVAQNKVFSDGGSEPQSGPQLQQMARPNPFDNSGLPNANRGMSSARADLPAVQLQGLSMQDGMGMGGGAAASPAPNGAAPVRYFFREPDPVNGDDDSITVAPLMDSSDARLGRTADRSAVQQRARQMRQMAVPQAAPEAMSAERESSKRASEPALETSTLDGQQVAGSDLSIAGTYEVQSIQIQSSPDLLEPQLVQIQQLLAAQNIVSEGDDPNRDKKTVSEDYAPLRNLGETTIKPIQLIVSGRAETLDQLAQQILQNIAGRPQLAIQKVESKRNAGPGVPILQINILPATSPSEEPISAPKPPR